MGAQSDPGVLLELRFTPVARAQFAIWIEDDRGRLLKTLALTEAVAYRGIGNRPGASEMNSGYRWPYGRREGVLPIWATRRAQAPRAKPFQRVVFQKRIEGHASQEPGVRDQSRDDYFCLSFTRETSNRDALDAVSCASIFSSDKGRFMTEADIAAGYAEPFEPEAGVGAMAALSLTSLYPPRMDVTRCTATGCFDHVDVDALAAHVREVMPDIDAITTATLPGDVSQSLLFSLPGTWPRGDYTLWVEVATEGDYNSTYGPTGYPTPLHPSAQWDYWARTFGYPYRGQPSIAFAVPLSLGESGEQSVNVSQPRGQASWAVWEGGYGQMLSLAGITDDPAGAPGSGADRLRAIQGAPRLSVVAEVLQLAQPEGDDPWADIFGRTEPSQPPNNPPVGGDGDGDGDGGSGGPAPVAGQGGSAGAAGVMSAPDERDDLVDEGEPRDPSEGVIVEPDRRSDVGAIRGLRLSRHPDELRSHSWALLELRAPSSKYALHRYEVRLSTEPIVDEATFLRHGRAAKTATDAIEGAVMLMLPVDVPAGERIATTIGDLVAETEYYVAVRAVDRRNQVGPISVARITTTSRTFATVSPCFIATATYGTALAPQVNALRKLRDRYLMPHALGRAWVNAYYALSPRLANAVRERSWLATAARAALEPVAQLASWLTAPRRDD